MKPSHQSPVFYPLIVLPHKQGRARRVMFGIMTLLGWVMWFALWTPLWHYVCPFLSRAIPCCLRQTAIQPVVLNNLSMLVIIPCICTFLLLSWASYNYHRFAKLTRRKTEPKAVQLIEECEKMKVPNRVGITLRSRRQIIVHFNDHQAHDAKGIPTGEYRFSKTKK